MTEWFWKAFANLKNKQNVYIVDFSLREENLQIIDCKLAPIKEKYGINSEVDH